jgi:hypothetical protein
MADLTLAEAQKARDNLARKEDLERRIAQIESQTIAWMAEAVVLHGDVVVADRPAVLAMRDDLVARLTAAVAIP